MLNMQNVKDIEITEGDVRTIHDKDSRLIWGRLAYDTKYAGDTYQQTYSGKNLLTSNGLTEDTVGNIVFTPVYDDNGVLMYINANGTATTNANYNIGYVNFVKDLSYTISGCNGGSGSTYRFWTGSSSAFPAGNRLSCENGSNTKTALADDSNCVVYIQVFLGTVLDNVKFYPQIEQSSSPTSYEPYVGGTPSPNPDYPQDIKVVTGEQTVTIGDGVSSQSYVIDLTGKNLINDTETHNFINSSGVISSGDAYLGITDYVTCSPSTEYAVLFEHGTDELNLYVGYKDSEGSFITRTGYGLSRTFTTPDNAASVFFYMTKSGATPSIGGYVQLEKGSTPTSYEPYYNYELCKIGDYQDYVYKSGDDWYVHKDIGKYVFDGSESWTSGLYGTNSWILANVIMTQYDSAKTQILSTKFRGVANNDRSTSGDNVIYTASNYQVWIRETSLTSLSDVQTATSGTPAYYRLATATDTKITDATLLGQLDAIHEWLTRYGYSSTVTGNLPIIINQTNL